MRLSNSGVGAFRVNWFRALAALVLLGMPACVGRADAGMLILTDTGYQVTFPDGVSVTYDGIAGKFPDTNAPFLGTLTVDASFSTNSKITLNFVQTAVDPKNAGLGASNGLRIALDSLMANGTDKAWGGFTYALQDQTDLSKVKLGSQDAHLSVAHFHPQSDPKHTGTATYTTTGFSVVKGEDNNSSIVLDVGQVDPGNEFTLKDALIHERNYQDTDGKAVLRSFDLILTPTPVPEPGSLVLFALGIGGLASYGWRHCRRVT